MKDRTRQDSPDECPICHGQGVVSRECVNDHALAIQKINWIDAISQTQFSFVLASVLVFAATLSAPREGTAQEKDSPAQKDSPRAFASQQTTPADSSLLGLNRQLNGTDRLPRREESRSAPGAAKATEAEERSLEMHGGLALTKVGFGFTATLLVRQGERGGAVRGVLTQGLLGGSYKEGGGCFTKLYSLKKN